MSCDHDRLLLDAYADGELDAAHAVEVESHIAQCPACRSQVAAILAVRSAVAGLPAFEPASAAETVEVPVRARGRSRLVAQLSVAAAITLSGLAGVLLGRNLLTRSASDLATQVVWVHIRSLQAGHLTDVLSSDQHTVKPWFAGKLPFSPRVADLTEQGFPLQGGRVDFLDGHPAAALVFQRRKHIINVLEWPAAGAPSNIEAAELPAPDGYHVVRWRQDGMDFWAVSDVATADLRDLAAALEGRPPDNRPSP